MASVGSSIAKTSISTQSTTETITNLSVPLAATEVSHTLATNLKQVLIRSRLRKAELQIAFTATESGSKYVTIPKNGVFVADDLNLTGKTLYLQSSLAANTIEILEWT